MKKEVIILSLGGSVVVPDDIDTNFLKNFKKLIIKNLKRYKFIIITGGGKTCRKYQKAANSVTKLKIEDLDWLGIHVTWLNADLVRTIFKDVAYKCFIIDPTKKVKFDKVLIAGGWKPGWSTDYDAVLLAKIYRTKTIINMTNINYLHNKNPKKYKNTKIIKKTDWKGFRKIVGNKWVPGLNAPFDPIAAKLAQKLKLKLVLIGNNLKNFDNFLKRKKFKGSIVK